MNEVLIKRAKVIKRGTISGGSIVYWMSRDQRVENNWALIYASQLAMEKRLPFKVVFCLVPTFLNATIRQYGFMIKGLQQVEAKLKDKNIPFQLLLGNPEIELPRFCSENKISALITDFDPLKIKRLWLDKISGLIESTIITVDAHNIVPTWIASVKLEYGAYTLRPKIKKMLPLFLNSFPEVSNHRASEGFQEYDWLTVLNSLTVNRDVREVSWCVPGESEAQKVLANFIDKKLDSYSEKRNNPLTEVTSGLSPYLHFGQISAQDVAQQVLKAGANPDSTAAFLEELIIRRELSDNFCWYNPHYDSFEGFPSWAKESLDSHRKDKREFLYTGEQFEKAETHDLLWNAAQMEMVVKGKMHGYMRMYWAKKILEWTSSPEEALKIAIYLNDKYELDGRDPNGYTGCAWSIGGVHDRAWNSHPVFGMIRYMNYNGCKRKFDVNAYIKLNLP